MSSPETQTKNPEEFQTQPVPEFKLDDPENIENLEENSETRAEVENAPTSEAARELIKKSREQIEEKQKRDIALKWLIDNLEQGKLDQNMQHVFACFERALSKKKVSPDQVEDTSSEEDAEEEASPNQEEETEDIDLAEIKELALHLQTVFESFDKKIAELAGQTGYTKEKLAEKRTKIIFGLCDSVMNGHLKARDVINLCGESIEMVSKQNPTEKVKKMIDEGGYDAILYFDGEERKIYIFEDALADDFKEKTNNLDLRHAINHELSHPIVEQALEKNEVLVGKAREIIDNASKIKDCQSRHIRNQLEALENIDSDFAKLYPNGTEEQKKIFRQKRENRAATEIITDYTAMYLQSDGTEDGFITTCMEKTNKADLKKYLEIDGEIGNKLVQLNNTKDPAKKAELIAQLKTKANGENSFNELCKIYGTFYAEIKHAIRSNRGKFQNTAEREDMEDYFEFAGGFGGYGDYPGTNMAGGQSSEGGSFWKELAVAAGDVVKAMANEVNPTK